MELTSEVLDLIKTLIPIIVGAVIGFLGSIWFDVWKQHREKKELKSRIREELEIVKEKVANLLKKEEFRGRSFPQAIYSCLTVDIIRKLPVKISKKIQETYRKIGELGASPKTPEEGRSRYESVLDLIDETLNLLR